MKDHFTITVNSNMHIAHGRFLYGCNGMNLNIHEAPTGFRWQYRANETHPFEEEMVITDESGIYIAGSHGVRIENELLVCKEEKNEYGQFMYFEPISYVPIDLDAINPDLMTTEEKTWLNEYHKSVYEKISPYLNDKEKQCLKEYTREI
nr:M24 family metallopeptidase C-terminal domain-containing protein [Clostridium botulinum]